MSRMYADDPRIETQPIARGPGVFVSELDAAFEFVAPYLSISQRSKFAAELSDGRVPGEPHGASSGLGEDLDVEDDDLEQERVEASGKVAEMGRGEEGPGRDAIMPTRLLYEVAMLVTGRWGKLSLMSPSEMADPPAPSAAAFKPRRSIPIFRSNHGPGQWMSFPERMEKLEGLLRDRMEEAQEAYVLRHKRAKKKNAELRREGRKLQKASPPPSGKALTQSTNWVGAFASMLSAVKHVREQLSRPASQRTIFAANRRALGQRWGILGADGNSKLPFIAYSELPMSTCPGADECGVYQKDARTGSPSSGEKGHHGWCYSFTAWRYPASFTRQFLNTLANAADREFTILRALGDDATDGPDRYWTRVNAAATNLEREWIQYVKVQVLRIASLIVRGDLRKGRRPNADQGGRSVFLRLFVDGDIGTPDAVLAWMRAVSQMADRKELEKAFGKPAKLANGRAADARAMGPVLTYGYSKAWGEFVAADKMAGRKMWPENYTLNLSNASRYAGTDVEEAIRRLPITRGGFNAVDFRTQLKSLKQIDPAKLVIAEDAALPGVTAHQLRGLVELEDVRTPEDASNLLRTFFGVEADIGAMVKLAPAPGTGSQKDDAQNQKQFERAYRQRLQTKTRDLALARMLEDPSLEKAVKEELVRDEGYANIREALAAIRSKRRAAMAKAREEGKDPPKQKPLSFESEDRQHRKLIALLVHVLFRAAQHRQSGSCPLVCGNCVDLVLDPLERSVIFDSQAEFADLQARTGAVHRCASRIPTEGYVPPPGKTLPAGVEVERRGPTPGVAKAYRKAANGRVQLVGFYGAEIYIGLH